MAEVVILLGLAGAGYYLTYPRDLETANAHNMSSDEKQKAFSYSENYRDLHEMGMSYSVMKPINLDLTNLNEAWKPWSAPSQMNMDNVDDLYKAKSTEMAYIETYGYPFYFHKNGEVPLATTQQSNPNTEIISKTHSFRGDPNNSLTYYPRVYADGGEGFQVFSTRQANMMDSGEPTESNVVWVPKEGKLNRENNPWGPGGKLQKIYNRQQERLSLDKFTNRATVLAPVYPGRFNRN